MKKYLTRVLMLSCFVLLGLTGCGKSELSANPILNIENSTKRIDVIKPIDYNINLDLKKISDGEYYAGINGENIKEEKGQFLLKVSIFEEDFYRKEDLSMLKKGDSFFAYGTVFIVNSISEEGKILVINEEDEDNRIALKECDNGQYRLYGLDGSSYYSLKGSGMIPLANEVYLVDSSDSEEKSVDKRLRKDEIADFIRNDKDGFLQYTTKIEIKNGKIVRIERNN